MVGQQIILSLLSKSVVNFKVEDCEKAARMAISCGIDPKTAIMHGLAKGMEKVGILYESNEYFVPEVLLSAEALYAGLDILKPHVPKERYEETATIVIGTVRGDNHDIGRNLVKLMFEAAGWEVHDLGSDVPLNDFEDKVVEIKADILAMSAMMTTTMMGMKKVISRIRNHGHDCKIIIGGAPVNQDIADVFGADGYAESAAKAVPEAIKMLSGPDRFSMPVNPRIM